MWLGEVMGWIYNTTDEYTSSMPESNSELIVEVGDVNEVFQDNNGQ
jgi:hypothetical protein